jgi:hypothetical protein
LNLQNRIDIQCADYSGFDTSCGNTLFTDVGILALVPDKWESSWQVRHQVLTRLARYFKVVWMDPAQGWRELWFASAQKKEEPQSSENDIPGFAIYRHGMLLPQFHRPDFLATYTLRRRLINASNILRRNGSLKTVLYMWRPQFESALDILQYDLSCYHIDDEYSFSDVELPLDQDEVRLIRRVDQVFIHSVSATPVSSNGRSTGRFLNTWRTATGIGHLYS